MVGMEGSRCLEIRFDVRPGHLTKLPLLIALIKVDFVGHPAAAWR